MRTPKRKRLIVLLSTTLVLLGVYFGTYFSCVSIEFQPSKEPTLQMACARYRTGPFSEDFVSLAFGPARLIDAAYLRPARWEDRQHRRGEVDIPLPL
jgi:hypothetical protein